MNPIVAAMAAFSFTLGGVPVDMTAASLQLPMEPSQGSEGYLWPTAEVHPYQEIRMADGTIWKVKTWKGNGDGSVTVDVRPNLYLARGSKITVRAEDLGVPIWWSIDPYDPNPTPGGTGPVEPGQGDPIPQNPGPDPNPTPTDPPAPDPGGEQTN